MIIMKHQFKENFKVSQNRTSEIIAVLLIAPQTLMLRWSKVSFNVCNSSVKHGTETINWSDDGNLNAIQEDKWEILLFLDRWTKENRRFKDVSFSF